MWMFESILSLPSSIFPGLNKFWTQFVTDWTFRALWPIVACCDQFWPILNHCNPNSPNLTECDQNWPQKNSSLTRALVPVCPPLRVRSLPAPIQPQGERQTFQWNRKVEFWKVIHLNFMCCKKYWIHIKTNARNSMLELSDKLPISAIYGKWENTLAIYGCRGGEGGI